MSRSGLTDWIVASSDDRGEDCLVACLDVSEATNKKQPTPISIFVYIKKEIING